MEQLFFFRDNKLDLSYFIKNKYVIFNYQDATFCFFLKDYYVVVTSSCPEDQDSVYLTFSVMGINNSESIELKRIVTTETINLMRHPIFKEFDIVKKLYRNYSFVGSAHVKYADDFVSYVSELLKILTKVEELKAFI